MHISKILVYVCAVGLVACYKCVDEQCSNLPPVEPDYPAAGGQVSEEPEGSPAALESPCGKACQTFERLHCPEAKPSDNGVSCYRVCVKAARLRSIPAACWAAAPTVEALKACGGVRCVP